MIYFLIAMAIVAFIGVPLVIWFDKAKKELEEEDLNEDEDENEEDK